jgi:hypothetical protein
MAFENALTDAKSIINSKTGQYEINLTILIGCFASMQLPFPAGFHHE